MFSGAVPQGTVRSGNISDASDPTEGLCSNQENVNDGNNNSHNISEALFDLSSEAEDSEEQEDILCRDWLLAGYRACAEEAIRFLTEEEGLSASDNLVKGLTEHLALRILMQPAVSHLVSETGVGASPSDDSGAQDMLLWDTGDENASEGT